MHLRVTNTGSLVIQMNIKDNTLLKLISLEKAQTELYFTFSKKETEFLQR